MPPHAIKSAWFTSFIVGGLTPLFVDPTALFFAAQLGLHLFWLLAWIFLRCRHREHDMLNVYTKDGMYLYSKLMCVRCHQISDVPKPKGGPTLCT